MVDGEDCYIVIMHPQAELQLRSTATAGGWQDIQKYTQRADNLFKRSLGKYGNLILYSHPKIPVYNTGAAGVGVCYNLLLGAQAGFIAHGNSGNGMHYSWHEEIDDRGNLPVVDTGAIFGMQRAIWNSKSFSTMLCVSNYAGTAS
jgi:N4-gp56 family major capsid protein